MGVAHPGIAPTIVDEHGNIISRDNSYNEHLRYLVNKGHDFIIITSAGNGGRRGMDASFGGVFNFVTEPDLLERIVTVGSAQQEGDSLSIALHSNFGYTVDLVAPGYGIYSTSSRYIREKRTEREYCECRSAYFYRCICYCTREHVCEHGCHCSCYTEQFVKITPYNIYAPSYTEVRSKNGTSMAAPHVAGVAALVWSENPGLSGPQVRDAIVTSARRSINRIYDTRANRPDTAPEYYYFLNAIGALLLANDIDPYYNRVILRGHVYSSDTKQPLYNARVRLYRHNEFIREAYTNQGGAYRFLNLDAGEGYRITIQTRGYTPYIINDFAVAGYELTGRLLMSSPYRHYLEPSNHRGLDIVFALDDSGSINNANFWYMISATSDLISTALTIEDRVSLFTFDNVVRRHGGQFMPYLTSRLFLPTQRVAGMTALNQAIHEATVEFTRANTNPDAARVMIVITDGINNMGGPTPAALVQQANALGINIFTIGIGNVNTRFLSELAVQTGGEFFHIRDFHRLEEVFDNIRYGMRPLGMHLDILCYDILTFIFDEHAQDEYRVDTEIPNDSPLEEKYPDVEITIPVWDSFTIYTNGDVVVFEGRLYEAQWWTQGEAPGNQWGPWRFVEYL